MRPILKCFILIVLFIIFLAISYVAYFIVKRVIYQSIERSYGGIVVRECANKQFVFKEKNLFNEAIYAQNPIPRDFIYVKTRILFDRKKFSQYYLMPGGIQSIANGSVYSPWPDERWMWTIGRAIYKGYAADVVIIPEEVFTDEYQALIGQKITVRIICVGNVSISDNDLVWSHILHTMSFRAGGADDPSEIFGDNYVFYLALKKDNRGNWFNVGLPIASKKNR